MTGFELEDADDPRDALPRDAQRRIDKAFASMQYDGFLAQQRFSCCPSRALAAFEILIAKMASEVRCGIRGLVYTTEQSYDPQERTLWIGYSEPLEGAGLTTTEVGAIAVDRLREAGLVVEWDGDPNRRIRVRLAPRAAESDGRINEGTVR